jgi:hydrogenase maturation protease
MKTIILGYGNTLRSDDGFGYVAAELLEQRGNLLHSEIYAIQQLTPELAEDLRTADLAIFIDVNFGIAAGYISFQEVSPAGEAPTSLSHHLNPENLLAVTKALYGIYPQAYLFSVGAVHFEMGEDLSPIVKAALQPLVEQVEALVLSYGE